MNILAAIVFLILVAGAAVFVNLRVDVHDRAADRLEERATVERAAKERAERRIDEMWGDVPRN